MNSSLKRIALSALLAVALTGTASALSITPSFTPQWTGNDTGNKDANDISAILGLAPGSLTEVYKQNVGEAGDTGTLAGSYTTTFIPLVEPSGANIVYDGAPDPFLTTPGKYLFVKDGNQTPAWYLFDISGWNGIETLALSGFWPDQGAISHIAIYGGLRAPPGPPVPDSGATVALLGLALTAIALGRRKFLG
jgi:hypothetical protein